MDSSEQIVISRIKRIIEKYPSVWRVIHEPVQNSIDAIQKRDDIEQGTINLSIDFISGLVEVEDDGVGFPQNLNLLLPDGTDKTDGSYTLGYQGVGLKGVIYSTSSFRLLSNLGDENNWGIEIGNAKGYLDSDGQEQAPINDIDEIKQGLGTTISMQFDRSNLVKALEQMIESVFDAETNFKWSSWHRSRGEFLARNIHLSPDISNLDIFLYVLKYYLLTHTYIGSVNRLLECRVETENEVFAKHIAVNISINFDGLAVQETSNEFLQELIEDLEGLDDKTATLMVENKFIDFGEVVERQRTVNRRSINFRIFDFNMVNGGRVNNPTLQDNVYCKILLPNYEIPEDDFDRRYEPFISLLDGTNQDRKDQNVRRLQSLFPKILGVYILIGRMQYYEMFLGNNYGLKFIAANGVPTQHELTPRSSNQSFYFNPITFIINIDGKLNEGKTHLIDEGLKRQASYYFREAFESTLNRLAKEFVRTVPNTDRPIQTNLVEGKEIDIPSVHLKREPVDENTLIALFYQLLIVKEMDLPTYGLLGQGVFDGKFVFNDENIRSDNDLSILEFKVALTKLLNDFDNPNSAKRFRECDLIIVWDDDISVSQEQDWRVVAAEAVPTRNIQAIDAPERISTYLRDRDNEYRPLIVVKDWVIELDPSFS